MFAHYRQNGDPQTVETHLLGVAARASAYAGKVGLPLQGELIGLLHDLGKYSAEFQKYLQAAVGIPDVNQDEDDEAVDAKRLKGKIDHSSAGAQWIWQELANTGQLGEIIGQILALCIASHHSGLIDCISADQNHFGKDKVLWDFAWVCIVPSLPRESAVNAASATRDAERPGLRSHAERGNDTVIVRSHHANSQRNKDNFRRRMGKADARTHLGEVLAITRKAYFLMFSDDKLIKSQLLGAFNEPLFHRI